MRKSLIGRMAMVLGLGAAMSASGFKKSDVPMPTEIDHVDSGSGHAHFGTVHYFNHNKQHPKKNRSCRNRYEHLVFRSKAGLDTNTTNPFSGATNYDNSDDARRKRREQRAVAHANRHERRRNGIQYA